MDKKEDLIELEAKHGEKMIEVKVRFWTNNIAEGDGMIFPKHAWTSGVVRIKRNPSHGITPQDPLMFDSLMEIPQVIEQVLADHGISLHLSDEMKKYVTK